MGREGEESSNSFEKGNDDPLVAANRLDGAWMGFVGSASAGVVYGFYGKARREEAEYHILVGDAGELWGFCDARDIGVLSFGSLGIRHWLLVIGYWLLVIGYWLLVIGYWLLVIGYWLLVMGFFVAWRLTRVVR